MSENRVLQKPSNSALNWHGPNKSWQEMTCSSPISTGLPPLKPWFFMGDGSVPLLDELSPGTLTSYFLWGEVPIHTSDIIYFQLKCKNHGHFQHPGLYITSSQNPTNPRQDEIAILEKKHKKTVIS